MTPPRSDSLPTFIVIGTMKGGTTSLNHYLVQHPDVFMAQQKELNFFLGGARWTRGGIAWYRSQFAAGGDAIARGECSPNYTKYPDIPGVPERMAELLPDVRLIYVLRHPLERAIAHYLHSRSRGREHRGCERAITEEPRYVEASEYGLQVDRFLALYPRSQLMVMRSEDLRADPDEALAAIFRFVGVRDDWRPSDREDSHRTDARRIPKRLTGPAYRTDRGRRALRNAPTGVTGAVHRWLTVPATPAAAPLSARTTASLLGRFRADLERLRDRVGADFPGWDLGDENHK